MPQVQKESIISIYINTLSNHPLAIFKQLSKFVCDGVSSNSSKRGVFDHAKAECEMPLRKIAYTANLESGSTRENTNKIKKNSIRTPYNSTVRMKVRIMLLSLSISTSFLLVTFLKYLIGHI